jgi:hypothetical protein
MMSDANQLGGRGQKNETVKTDLASLIQVWSFN